MDEGSKLWANLRIDGNPDQQPGRRIKLVLTDGAVDPDPFDSLWMFIEDVTYRIGPESDLTCTLLLGERDGKRATPLTSYSVMRASNLKILNASKTRVPKLPPTP